MAAIAVGLAITAAQLDKTQPETEPPDPVQAPAEAGGALAQRPSPTTPPETPAPGQTTVDSAAETPSEAPPGIATPAPAALPSAPTATVPAAAPALEEIPAATDPMSAFLATPWPMPTPRDIYSWTLEVPILMYHYISHPPPGADQYRLDLSTSPELFRQQMLYLVENGYEAVDLYDLSLAIVDKAELPAKPIIITFDDGYRDNYENAFPVLKRLGLTATFFVATEFIDQKNPDYLDWTMIEEMAAAGMRIEPHSKTHPDLTLHDRDFIVWEVLGSQETIASHIGYRPRYFAYPGGRYNDEVLQIVAELDFWGAVTTANGIWHNFNDRFEWGRVRMRNTTSLTELGEMIN